MREREEGKEKGREKGEGGDRIERKMMQGRERKGR
jgi:hypothetical protein